MFLRFFALIALTCFFLYYFSIRITPEDAIHYQNLTAESFELRKERAFEKEPAFQKRENVRKDIWTQDETHHVTLHSQRSNLTLSQEKDKIEATETLHNICCQTATGSTFIADEGIYNYPSQQFILQKNCKLRQGDNEIAGTRIHFDLIDETASYENPQGHIAEGEVDFTAKILLWNKETNELYLHDDVTIHQSKDLTLQAENGTVYLDKLRPTHAILEGNVRLISSRIQDKESFAIADRLHYDLNNQTLLFSSDKRVLFWQDGFSLSAPEILIRKDQSVMGQGDVHFTFSLEEQNFIDQFFKHYL